MPFPLDRRQITELCHFASIADKEARSDLSLGYISGENDYTSNFTGALRRIINSNSRFQLSATSVVLPNSLEQRYGADAAIIIESKGDVKVSLFEAKLPRYGKGTRNWDSIQSTHNQSHFVNQLDRQSNANPEFAIFEMFYCEYAFRRQPRYMHDYQSSCTWHDDTLAFNNSRSDRDAVWNNKDLENLLKISNSCISDILEAICSCHRGSSLAMGSDFNNTISEFQLSGTILCISADEVGDDGKDPTAM
jgi:hypothetical protein